LSQASATNLVASDPGCIFCKIAKGQIPANKVFEDSDFIAFHDIAPKAPLHLLVIPKQHLVSLLEVGQEHQALLGKMLVLAPQLAKDNGHPSGFKLVINNGQSGGQEVYHLHMHVLGY
jgi:histidine triad (HIT) family protein